MAPGVIRERNSAMGIVLTIVTCGIYSLYWHYKVAEELRDAVGDTSISPALDVLLLLLTCGVFGIYLDYRNAQKIYELVRERDGSRKDQSQNVLLLGICAFVVAGATWLVSMFLLQEELNALSRASRNG